MTEYGMQTILTDRAYADANYRDFVRTLMTTELSSKGVAVVQFEEQRLIEGPRHDDSEYPDCPHTVFGHAHPGADEFPECGIDEHWLRPLKGWAIDAWGDAP